MRKNLVSIIIPVYNIEDNIAYCLDSVLNQSYEAIEIVVVDDGSTDSSADICDKYHEINNNLKVVHQKNGGLSCARNTGLRYSTGEYLFFLDGDDIIAADTIEKLVFDIKKYPEIIYASVKPQRIKKYEHFESVGDDSCKLYSTYKMIDELLVGRYENISAWGKLYRRSCIGKIRFIEGRIYNEDKVFLLMLFIKNRHAFFLEHNTKSYGYFVRENSITTAKFSERRLDLIRNSQTALNITKKYIPEYTSAAMQYDAGSHLALMHNIIRAGSYFKFYRLYHFIKRRLYEKYRISTIKQLGSKKLEYIVAMIDPVYFLCVKLYDMNKWMKTKGIN